MRSHNTQTPKQLFAPWPGTFELFEPIRNYIESLGDVEVATTKSQVSFGVKTKFAWVWLSQMWTKMRPGDSIVLTFDLDHQVKDRRIVESVEPRPGRWTHHVIIQKPSDFDGTVRDWLRQAYAHASPKR